MYVVDLWHRWDLIRKLFLGKRWERSNRHGTRGRNIRNARERSYVLRKPFIPMGKRGRSDISAGCTLQPPISIRPCLHGQIRCLNLSPKRPFSPPPVTAEHSSRRPSGNWRVINKWNRSRKSSCRNLVAMRLQAANLRMNQQIFWHLVKFCDIFWHEKMYMSRGTPLPSHLQLLRAFFSSTHSTHLQLLLGLPLYLQSILALPLYRNRGHFFTCQHDGSRSLLT